MTKVLSYPLSLIFFLLFGLALVIFHPIQWLCLKAFGYRAHKASVSVLNLLIMAATRVLGTRYSFLGREALPPDRPMIVVTNHQSMFDIPPIIWYLRRHHPKFVSKKELAKGIPSVSFNLRHGGSILIDRGDSRQAIGELQKLGRSIARNHHSAVIFPEGTRSRDGRPKPFKTMGLKVLIKAAPNALIVPISINDSWKLQRYGKFPMGLGAHLRFQVHPPLEIEGEVDGLIARVEELVRQGINPGAWNGKH